MLNGFGIRYENQVHSNTMRLSDTSWMGKVDLHRVKANLLYKSMLPLSVGQVINDGIRHYITTD